MDELAQCYNWRNQLDINDTIYQFTERDEEWFFANENFFFQAEDGIRDLVRSRGLGDVYKRQTYKYIRV